MRLSQLQKRTLISEGWNDPAFTLFEQKTIQPWVADVEKYVTEAALSKQQITQLFTSIEKGADEAGDNRTGVGKAKDIAGLPVEALKWIDGKINELGRAVQQAGPVKNADQKFDELKTKIGAKDSKVVNAVKAVSDWAKANPGKASIAVGILTAAAAIAGGPLGGAVAGFLARATKDLLQGEKLSTAVGKSVKTAAYGALAGAAIQGITDNIIDNIAAGSEAEATAMMDGFEKANFTAAVDKAVADAGFDSGVLDGAQNLKMSGNINGFYYDYDLTMTPEQVAQYKALSDAANSAKTFSPEYYEAAGKLHGFLSTTQDANESLTALAKTVGDIPRDALTSDQLEQAIAVLDNADAAIEKIMDVGGPVAAAAQGALQTVDDNAKNKHNAKPVSPEQKAELTGEAPAQESKTYTGTKLSEGQIYLLFNKITKVNDHMLENKLMFESVFDAVAYYNRQTINEAPGILKKAADAIGKGVGAIKQAGRNLTAKVTADKLMKAWQKAGEPTDSNEIADQVLKPAGVADDVIKGTYDAMKIELPTAQEPAADAAQDTSATDTATDAGATDAATDTATDTATDAGATDTDAPTDDAAATGDTATTSATPTTGGATSSKDERYYLQKNTKDETKVDIIDKQTSKPIKDGVGLAPEKAEPMSDKMNKEAGKFEPQEGDKFIMQPNAQNPKTYDVLDTQTDQPVEKGEALQPGEAEELRDKLNTQATTSTTSTTTSKDGATDANTASTAGDQGADATTTPQDTETPAQDATSTDTQPDAAANPGEEPYAAPDRTQGQKDYNPTQKTPAAPVNMGDLVVQIKKLKPEVQAIIKKELAA